MVVVKDHSNESLATPKTKADFRSCSFCNFRGARSSGPLIWCVVD
jgi:hypothetical protein